MFFHVESPERKKTILLLEIFYLFKPRKSRWNRKILQWRPWAGQRSRGRPI